MDNTHCLRFLRTEKSSPTGRRLLFLFIRHARARSLLCVRLHKPEKQVPGTKLSCISKDCASSLAMDGRDQARRWSALLSHVQHCCLRWTCSSLGLLCQIIVSDKLIVRLLSRINFLHLRLGLIPIWPKWQDVEEIRPASFKETYPSTYAIFLKRRSWSVKFHLLCLWRASITQVRSPKPQSSDL